MRLTELRPTFLTRLDDKNSKLTDSIGEADGIRFLCPKCFKENGGPVGTHSVICWKPSVPQTTFPTPGRWNLVGTGYNDLSLVAGSSSVLIKASEKEKAAGIAEHWHGFVTNGEVTGA